ncbi:MAG: 7-carboxy-7-deazaguanine synthase QueE [Euryarchaeota archaeon]|nr:7-carboxy-7-deazaguanine synthase QueE [Euryarchaeota archaeon]
MAAKAHVNEVFNSIQGEGPYAGTRQVFVRFQGCPLSCVYCDSTSAKPFQSAREVTCSSTRTLRNPVSTKDLTELVESLWTTSTQHLSLTGGEPLLHTNFILELAQEFSVPLYLETNAMFSRDAQQLKNVVHIAACDIKLPEHRATATYNLLLNEELRTVKCFHNSPAYVFAKVVVLKETSSEMIELVAQHLSTIDNNLLLVLQPVTPMSQTAQPDNSQLLRLMDIAAAHLNRVRVIPQMHVQLGIA